MVHSLAMVELSRKGPKGGKLAAPSSSWVSCAGGWMKKRAKGMRWGGTVFSKLIGRGWQKG